MNFLKSKLNVIAAVLIAVFLVSVPASAQLTTRFGGEFNAIDYAYGAPGVSFPALSVAAGNGATGASQTITLVTGATVNSSGVSLNPITTTTPIIVGIGSNAETVTPTAVSNCNLPSTQTPAPGQPACTITGTFNNLHGPQEPVISGSYGVQEAVNQAHAFGGVVIISPGYTQLGGTTAAITAATAYPNVYVRDNRVGSSPYWTFQPTTLTTIAAPLPTLSSTTAVFSAAPVGTWANSAYYLCYTVVDSLGGESACSATSNQTPTVNYSLTVAPPTATAGAVGWRMYAGASYALAYLLPVTSAACTLTTAETVVPACAMTSSGLWPAAPLTTTSLAPVALGITNSSQPVPQSHTTFGFQASGSAPAPFQTNYGPFGSGTIASAGTTGNTVLGSINLPAGFLNQIGRTVRFTGKIVGGETATGTLVINVGIVWAGGVTAGAPVAVCIDTTTSVFGTQNYTIPFSCTWTTNAVGATAIGSIQADSWLIAAGPSTTNIVGSDTGAAAVGSLGLFSQDQVYVYLNPSTEPLTAARLMDFHIELLQ